MLVWGERTQRLMGTSRVTAMCENCQKTNKTEEDENAATAAAASAAAARVTDMGDIASLAWVAGLKAQAAAGMRPAWAGGAVRDTMNAPAMLPTVLEGGATGGVDPRMVLAARLGIMPAAAPVPAAPRAPADGARLGIPMAKST